MSHKVSLGEQPTLKIVLKGDVAQALVRWIGDTSDSSRMATGLTKYQNGLLAKLYADVYDLPYSQDLDCLKERL